MPSQRAQRTTGISGCLALIFTLTAGFLNGEAVQKRVLTEPTRIEAVTVFLDRAQVQRNLSCPVTPGVYQLTVPGLPTSIDDYSVRASGQGSAAVRILDIKVRPQRDPDTRDQRTREIEKEKQAIRESIRVVDDRLALLTTKKKFLESVIQMKMDSAKERKYLDKIPIPEWTGMMGFIETGLDTISSEVRSREQEKAGLKDKEAGFDFDLSQLESQRIRNKKEITVQFEVLRPGSMSLNLYYIIPGATWAPIYDLRFTADSREMELWYHAQVRQQTGEDWENVRITLSTARTVRPTALPELTPIRLGMAASTMIRDSKPKQLLRLALTGSNRIFGQVTDSEGNPLPGVEVDAILGNQAGSTITNENGNFSFFGLPNGNYQLRCSLEGFKRVASNLTFTGGEQRQVNMQMPLAAITEEVVVTGQAPLIDTRSAAVEHTFRPESFSGVGVPSSGGSSSRESERQVTGMEAIGQATARSEITEKSLNIQYTLKQRDSIASTNQPQKVTIAIERLPCRKEYLAAPILFEATYLKATVKNTTPYPLLAGRANLFYDENYLSPSQIPPVNANEEFSVSVGEDTGIRIKREIKSKREEIGLFTKKTQVTFETVISLENFHQTEEKIRLQDQIPLSDSKEIEVELLPPAVALLATPEAEKELKEKGNLSWDLTLGPLEKREVRFTYRVTTPRDSNLLTNLER